MFGKEIPKEIPVFVINGFLDSGKSSFFSYTIGQSYFRSRETTLLILCEEGEVEYTDALLKQTRTKLEVIDSVEEFTPSALMALHSKHQPGRVLIEWNGMWDFRKFCLPDAWELEQQISCIDASTFGLYFSNLATRSLLFEELRNSELIMFNRCDGIAQDTLIQYKRNVKAACSGAELIFEDANGEIDVTTEEDLPFDLGSDPIRLDDQGYATWYIDSFDHLDRYIGKRIQFTAMVAKPDGYPSDHFVPGRMAMTCCAEDMQFLGFVCVYPGAAQLKERDWINVTAEVRKEAWMDYKGEGPVLYATTVTKTRAPKNKILSFM